MVSLGSVDSQHGTDLNRLRTFYGKRNPYPTGQIKSFFGWWAGGWLTDTPLPRHGGRKCLRKLRPPHSPQRCKAWGESLGSRTETERPLSPWRWGALKSPSRLGGNGETAVLRGGRANKRQWMPVRDAGSPQSRMPPKTKDGLQPAHQPIINWWRIHILDFLLKPKVGRTLHEL